MDIQTHFQSYRASLQRDALPEATDYAKMSPTKKPDQFPTVYHYLNFAKNNVEAAATAGHLEGYKIWLARHQDAMIALFERMTVELLSQWEEITFELLFDMVHTHGWKWFKFSPKSLEMTLNINANFKPRMRWIPRYDPKYRKQWEAGDMAVLDADEMRLLFEQKPGPTVVHDVLRFKEKTPAQKILKIEDGTALFKPVAEVNSGGVVLDWTLKLF